MSGGLKLPVSHCETETICGIQFGVFKASQLKQFGVCHVTSSISYTLTGEPKPNGLADRRMGSTEPRVACETCAMEHPDCPGHFGFTELSEPLFNIGLFDITYSALSCICQTCGSLLAPVEERGRLRAADAGLERLRLARQLRKSKCEQSVAGKSCGAEQAIIRKPPPKIRNGIFFIASRNMQETVLYASHVFQMLNRISDEDAVLMGFRPENCHPRDLILTVLPIPPPAVRPSVSFGGAARSENELTVQLGSVLKVNEKLRSAKDANAPVNTLVPDIKRLQELVSCFINNASTYYNPGKLRGKLPLKSLTERLKGKQGRLRGYLMGKRVDFSARTVITGDPLIDVDNVGVPRSIAMTLTIPEKVNYINRKWLTGLVQSTVYPGANYIIHKNGAMRNLAKMQAKARKRLTLEIGDTVERHLQDGDPVLFNRQPTLHRMSMMGHRARVLPFNTFRLNLTCTTPYNADFDGDEMNLHTPQSLLTKAELIEIMMVTKNFVTPNKSQPCMGIVQDSLLGCFRVTDRETFLDKYFMQSLLLWLTKDRQNLPVPAILKPQPLWTGKQVFSLVVPEVNVGGQDPHKFKHDDSELVIRRGLLISGMISKSVVGVSAGSLIHVIYNEKGADEVVRFVNAVQRTVAYYLYHVSFSVGMQDAIVTQSTLDDTKLITEDAEQRARAAAAAVSEGTLAKKPGMTLLESFENESNQILNNARKDAAAKTLASVKRTNAFRSMILAGSKGGELNIFQIAVQVGQQNVNGKRIPFHFRRRTLPHYTKDDYLPQSRGLVKNGFVAGLTPFEFIFHTMGGREGLIDTACKTAETGYLQRKLIKSMEDVHVAYDGTVRNVTNEVVQFMYGEDGLDGHRIEPNQKIDVVKHDDKAMRSLFRYEYGDDGAFASDFGGDYMTPELKRFLRSDKASLGILDREFNNMMRDRDVLRELLPELSEKVSMYLPVNVERLIHNAQAFYDVGRKSQQSSLDPRTIVTAVERLERDIRQLFASHSKRRTNYGGAFDNPICESRIADAVQLFSLHLRTTLASKRVLKDYRLNETAFNYLLSEIRLKFMQSIVNAGEMIGAIAAQSCGEPATQMTLNTFHNAGISSKNVTLGVPRLLELLNVSKNQRVSNMVIRLVPEYSTKSKAGMALHQIESTSLLSLVTGWSIVYDPDPLHSVIEADNSVFHIGWDVLTRTAEIERLSPWIARIELDATQVTLKRDVSARGIMEAIRTMLEAKLEEFNVEVSSDFHTVVKKYAVVRLRLRDRDKIAEPIAYLRERVPVILQSMHVRGVPGVTKVFTQERKMVIVNPETGGLKSTMEWFLETEGTALRSVMSNVTDRDGVSIIAAHLTSSNNIPEINDVLGIEAARKKLLLEMREVYAGYDIRINYRQYSLLVDTMCHRGYIMAVSRTGINRINSVGPLMRCSFEETVNVLMGAAAFGEFDPTRGVSACIALGKQARIGTGIFDLFLNADLLRDAVPQKEAVEVGRVANVYAGASTVAYRRAAEAEASSGGGGGGRATPLFDRSVVMMQHRHGGGGGGGGGGVSAHSSLATPAHLGAAGLPSPGIPAVASAAHYSEAGDVFRGAGSVMYSGGGGGGGGRGLGGGTSGPGIFLPPSAPSAPYGQPRTASSGGRGESPGYGSSSYLPANVTSSLPTEWTATFGGRGAFSFESADASGSYHRDSARGGGGGGGGGYSASQPGFSASAMSAGGRSADRGGAQASGAVPSYLRGRRGGAAVDSAPSGLGFGAGPHNIGGAGARSGAAAALAPVLDSAAYSPSSFGGHSSARSNPAPGDSPGYTPIAEPPVQGALHAVLQHPLSHQQSGSRPGQPRRPPAGNNADADFSPASSNQR